MRQKNKSSERKIIYGALKTSSVTTLPEEQGVLGQGWIEAHSQ